MTQNAPNLLYGMKDFLEYQGGFHFSVCYLNLHNLHPHILHINTLNFPAIQNNIASESFYAYIFTHKDQKLKQKI